MMNYTGWGKGGTKCQACEVPVCQQDEKVQCVRESDIQENSLVWMCRFISGN